MSAPFQPGEVVVCVDARPARHRYFLQPGHSPAFPCSKGALYRVREVALSETGQVGIRLVGIFLPSYHKTGAEYVIHPRRFRKLTSATAKFTAQMRACKPVKTEQPA